MSNIKRNPRNLIGDIHTLEVGMYNSIVTQVCGPEVGQVFSSPRFVADTYHRVGSKGLQMDGYSSRISRTAMGNHCLVRSNIPSHLKN
jgi:hypothetical protein